jgi:hypothetical protein
MKMECTAMMATQKGPSPTTIVFLVLFDVALLLSLYHGLYAIPVSVAIGLLAIFLMCFLEKSLFLIPFFIVFSCSIPFLNIGGRTVNIGFDYIFLTVLVSVWLMRKALSPSGSLVKSFEFKKPLIIFTILQGFSAIRAFLTFGYIDSLLYLIIWILYLFMFLIVVDMSLPVKMIKQLIVLMLIMANAVAVYGIVDYLLTGGIRIVSVFGGIKGGPNILGIYLAIFALFSICFAIYYKGVIRVLMLLSVVTLSIVVTLTLSRSSWLGLAAGMLVIGVLRRRSLVFWVSLVMPFAIFILPEVVIHRAKSILEVASNPKIISFFLNISYHMGNTKVGAMEYLLGGSGLGTDVIGGALRYVTWIAALNLFRQFPILGSGIFNIVHLGRVGTTESLYLEILSGTGILGTVAFLFFGLKLIQYAVNAYCRVEDGFAHHFALGYLATLVALGTVSITGNVALSPKLLGLFWLLTGCLLTIKESAQHKTHFSN